MSKQTDIATWAEATFGPVASNMLIAARVNEDMAELIMKLAHNDHNPEAAEEMADIVIILYRLADKLGVDLDGAVDAKMNVNYKRKWNLTGNGLGYHQKPTNPMALSPLERWSAWRPGKGICLCYNCKKPEDQHDPNTQACPKISQ